MPRPRALSRYLQGAVFMPDKGRVYSSMSLSGARWLVGHPRKLQDFISVGSI